TVDGAATPSEATCTLMHDNNDIANTCTITATDDAENTATVNRSVWWRKNVVFVNKSATGSQDGTTWKTAYRELHTALNPGTNWPIGTEIWVAEGNYGHAPDPAYEIQVKPHNISIFG